MEQKLRPDLVIRENIGRLRRQAGLTQDETVARLNVRGIDISKSSYAKIETNRMNIKISEILALKEILHVDSFDSFFEGLKLPRSG